MSTHCLKKMLVVVVTMLSQESLLVLALLPVMKRAISELAFGPACAAL